MVYTKPIRRNFAVPATVFWVREITLSRNHMSKRTRFLLLLVALALAGLALAALSYAMPELEPQRLQATLLPTLFIPPPP